MAKTAVKDTKPKAKPSIASVLAELANEGVSFGEFAVNEPKWYTTGNMAIDAIFNGGVPVGKIVEFAGPNASGKTTTAVSVAANIIQEGGIVAFFDLERAMDKPYFRALGVDPDDSEHFLYFAPRTLEEAANTLRKLLKTGLIRLAIMDSVARMITQSELDSPTGTITVMDKAKMLYQFCRQVVDDLADNECTLIFLNHLLEKVDMSWAGKKKAAQGIKEYTTPGGNAIPFFASLRAFFSKDGNIYAEEVDPITNEATKTAIGYKHTIHVAKNKVGKPEGDATVINIMGEGFSQTRTAFEILKSYDIVVNPGGGAWFDVMDENLKKLSGDKKYQGAERLYNAIVNNPEAKGTMINMAKKFLDDAYNELPELGSIPEEELVDA